MESCNTIECAAVSCMCVPFTSDLCGFVATDLTS